MSLDPPRPFRSALLGAVLWTFAAVVVYGLLRQDVFFKSDGPYLVLNLDEGRCSHPYNAGYMPLLFGFAALARPFGLTAFEIAGYLSVGGTALGIGVVHLAFARLGMARAALHTATGLVFVTPAIAFFATVVEHHGPFLPFAALSFLCAVQFARRPKAWRALLLGASTHVAYLVHGTGNLLPGLLFPLVLAWRARAGTLRSDLGLLALAGTVHLGLFFGLLEFELGGADAGGGAKLGAILGEGIGRPRGLTVLPGVLWHELVWPFVPTLLGALLALRIAALRGEWSATAVGAVPYVGICAHLIAGEPEFGAYLLPLAFPLARLTALASGSSCAVVFGLAALGIAYSAITSHERASAAEQRAWCDGIRDEAADRDVVLVLGGTRELAFTLAGLPQAERLIPSIGAALTPSTEQGEDLLARTFDAWLAVQRDAHKVVLFTAGAMADLADPAIAAGASLVSHVRAQHVVREIASGPLRAWRLTP